MTKILGYLTMFAILFATTIPVYADGEGTGANAIFDLIGVEKPAQWNTWGELQKHQYLQNLGAYPAQGRKYKGRVDLDRYFQTLGIPQPDNWLSLTTQERINFITNLNTPNPSPTPQSPPTTTTQTSTTKPETPAYSKSILTTPWLVITLAAITFGVSIHSIQNIKDNLKLS